MRLKVQTNNEHYFRFLLEVLSAFNPFNKLRNSQKDLFAELLKYNYKYKDVPKEERFILILGHTVRQKICSKLGVSKANIDNNISLLRKMGFITQDNQIPDKFLFPYKAPFIIEFKEEQNEDK